MLSMNMYQKLPHLVAVEGWLTSTPRDARTKHKFNFMHSPLPSMTDSKYLLGHNLPKLQTFSREEPLAKGEVTYKEWHFEIKCLQTDPSVTDSQLMQALIRTLRGSARQVLISLREKGTLVQVLHKA